MPLPHLYQKKSILGTSRPVDIGAYPRTSWFVGRMVVWPEQLNMESVNCIEIFQPIKRAWNSFLIHSIPVNASVAAHTWFDSSASYSNVPNVDFKSLRPQAQSFTNRRHLSLSGSTHSWYFPMQKAASPPNRWKEFLRLPTNAHGECFHWSEKRYPKQNRNFSVM